VRQNLCSCSDFDGRTWCQVDVSGWLEAFAAHPRIGDVETLRTKFASERYWNFISFSSGFGSEQVTEEEGCVYVCECKEFIHISAHS